MRDDGTGQTFIVASNVATGAFGSTLSLSTIGRVRAAAALIATTSIAIWPLATP